MSLFYTITVRLKCPTTVGICDARPLTGSRLCPGPFGWANAATDSVSGRVWAETTSCPAYKDILHACPLCKCVVIGCRVPRYSEGNRMLSPQIYRTLHTHCTVDIGNLTRFRTLTFCTSLV